MSDLRQQDGIEQARRTLALEASPLTSETEAQEKAQTRATRGQQNRKRYWRSVGDLLKSSSFRQWAHDEFPQLDAELNEYHADGPSRRSFLQLMGASIALAGFGIAGCRRPEAHILPYNTKPVGLVIGRATYYATTFVKSGVPIGLLAETHEGRPTKIEGNPLHPNNRGGTDVYAQASVLTLYDPERSRSYRQGQQAYTRDEFVAEFEDFAKQAHSNQGTGLAILLDEMNSPAVDMVLDGILHDLPKAQLYRYEPLMPDPSTPRALLDLKQAKVIVALDADLVGCEDEGTRYSREFIDGRRGENGKFEDMNQLYVVEPAMSSTGAIADHRLALPASQIGAFAQALLASLSGQQVEGKWNALAQKWITVLGETLKEAGDRAVVVAGTRQGPAVQAVVAQINQKLGSVSKLVRYLKQPQYGSITELADQMRAGSVKTLLIIHGNPVYDAPADLKFAELLKQVPLSMHLALYDDETSAACSWHIPATHYLESWGDARASDGTLSIVQPTIDPLYEGMSALELLAHVAGVAKPNAYELTRESFQRYSGTKDEEAWREFVQSGVFVPKSPARDEEAMPTAGQGQIAQPPADTIEVCFTPDPSVYDGRFANNGWLQEMPDPITKLSWDNAALIGPDLAKRLKVETGDMVKIEVGGNAIEAPVFLVPGVTDNSVTISLGYGRTSGGKIAEGSGFNAYILRTSKTMGFATGAKVTPTGATYPLASTQEHWALDLEKGFESTADAQAKERAIIREVTPEQLAKDPEYVRKQGEHAPIHLSIYTEPDLTGANQWAMMIDLNACVGCNACVIACQAENNVPIVGKNQVIRGREMHWLRLDRYFAGENNEHVQATLQPMFCQQCENAPCEPVCPVNATNHSPEGLNEMVYNRCIGTRYCSNNCPYKVRRFNFLDWNKGTIREDTASTKDGHQQPNPLRGLTMPQSFQPPMQQSLMMAENPNVTVRIRGVMEKCTYCVQRIEAAKIAVRSSTGQGPANAVVHRADGKDETMVKVPEGMIQTACQQSCPTKAIIFGDKSDPKSKFYQAWNAQKGTGNPRSYEVLEHLNVRPRNHYLAKVRNVNPKLEEA